MNSINDDNFESIKQTVGGHVSEAMVLWADNCTKDLLDHLKIKLTRNEENYIVLDFLIYFDHVLESLLEIKLDDEEKKDDVIDYINSLIIPIVKRDYLKKMEINEIAEYIRNGIKEYNDYFLNLMEAGKSTDSHLENLLSTNISGRINKSGIGLIEVSKLYTEIIDKNMKIGVIESFVDRLNGGNGTTIVPNELVKQWNVVMDTSDYFAKYRELSSATLLLGKDAAPLFRGVTHLVSTLPHPKGETIKAFASVIDAIKKGLIDLPSNFDKKQYLNSAETLMYAVYGFGEDYLREYEMHSKIAGNLLADHKILFDDKGKIKINYYFDKRLFPLTTDEELLQSAQIREDEKRYNTLYEQVKKTNNISLQDHFILMELIVKNAFRELSKGK